jgi:hypothetical protein
MFKGNHRHPLFNGISVSLRHYNPGTLWLYIFKRQPEPLTCFRCHWHFKFNGNPAGSFYQNKIYLCSVSRPVKEILPSRILGNDEKDARYFANMWDWLRLIIDYPSNCYVITLKMHGKQIVEDGYEEFSTAQGVSLPIPNPSKRESKLP